MNEQQADQMNENLGLINRTLEAINHNLFEIQKTLDSIDRYGVSMIDDQIQSTTNNKNAFKND